MPEKKKKFGGRQDGAGRPVLAPDEKKRRVVLYVSPSLAAHLEAEEVGEEERSTVARRRKRQAAELLAKAEIESRIIL